MKQRPKFQAQVDDEGRLVLPRQMISHFGLKPGVQVEIDDGENYLCLQRPITHLAKVYIEPTNACNLECRTCIRNVWDEPVGQMSVLRHAGGLARRSYYIQKVKEEVKNLIVLDGGDALVLSYFDRKSERGKARKRSTDL